MANVALILSGCGYLDGAEIRESVLALLELERAGHNICIFSIDKKQHVVVEHLSKNKLDEERNVLNESARIARGDIQDMKKLNVSEFDALVIPGGFGVATNLSNLAYADGEVIVEDEFKRVVESFYDAGKPIGAICIAPAVVGYILKDKASDIKLTLGNESDLLSSFGLRNNKCDSDDVVVDNNNLLVSTPAYMHEDSIVKIHQGILKLVKEVSKMVK